MGRHSAPDDRDAAVEAVPVTTTTIDVDSRLWHGRHARPDEDQDTEIIPAIVADEPPTAVLPPVDLQKPPEAAPTVEGPPPKAKKAPKPPKAKKAPKAKKPKAEQPPKTKRTKKDGSETDTQADLRVLRENPAVRARCIAAVLLSFLVYTVVMVVLDKAGSYLFWLWVPIVCAGVVVGAVLDLAHRSAKKNTATVHDQQG